MIFDRKNKEHWFRLIVSIIAVLAAPLVLQIAYSLGYAMSSPELIERIIGKSLYFILLALYLPAVLIGYLRTVGIVIAEIWLFSSILVLTFIYQYFFSILYIKIWKRINKHFHDLEKKHTQKDNHFL